MKIFDFEQGTPEWAKARRGIPTSSECDRIVTAGGKKSASQTKYLGELIEEIRDPNYVSSFMGNEHTERGKKYEPKARKWYEFTHPGVVVRQVGFITNDDGTAGCSPDSLLDTRGGLEIKCPEGKLHAAWCIDGELPAEHKVQVHASMALTGADYWDFLSYSPGYNPFCVRVLRDAYTGLVEREIDAFLIRRRDAIRMFLKYLPEGTK